MRDDDTAGNLLSTYLLQGWVMTDELCKIPGCSYPLMRSKDGSISFCTKHDELPNAPNANGKKSEPKQQQQQQQQQVDSIVTADDELRIRRERREQSSKASQLIGQKMLQRWALLNEQCPNESCYAVPLIRNPDTKKMFCVICENYILSEEEAAAVEAEKLKKEKEAAAEKTKTTSTTSESTTVKEPIPETKPVHSPILSSSSTEEFKRQKIEKKPRKHRAEKKSRKSSTESSTSFTSDAIVSKLSSKMEELTDRVEECEDPVELTQLFKAIKSCASAIQACAEAAKKVDFISK